MTEAVRTPEDALTGLPDFPFASHHREVDGLRLAHLDEGQGAPVLFMHGEPTWSFLWRKVIPPVRDAGFRCVSPDLAGFGRSDKPVDIAWYTYDRHTATASSLLEDLDLRDATVVVHDWGGPIGLRLAVEHPDRIARFVILDTGLFTGRQRMTDAWIAFSSSAPMICPWASWCAARARTTPATRSSPPMTRPFPTPPPRPAREPFR